MQKNRASNLRNSPKRSHHNNGSIENHQKQLLATMREHTKDKPSADNTLMKCPNPKEDRVGEKVWKNFQKWEKSDFKNEQTMEQCMHEVHNDLQPNVYVCVKRCCPSQTPMRCVCHQTRPLNLQRSSLRSLAFARTFVKSTTLFRLCTDSNSKYRSLFEC